MWLCFVLISIYKNRSRNGDGGGRGEAIVPEPIEGPFDCQESLRDSNFTENLYIVVFDNADHEFELNFLIKSSEKLLRPRIKFYKYKLMRIFFNHES